MTAPACQQHDPRLWDDHVDGEAATTRARRHARARTICAHCPLQAPCRAAATDTREGVPIATGIWAAVLFTAAQDHHRGLDDCAGCARPMHRGYRRRHTLPTGHVVHGARGLCTRCHDRGRWRPRSAR